MKKINNLQSRVENAITEKLWAFKKLTNLRNYLTKILNAKELFHLRREVAATIESWSDNEVTPLHKTSIKHIMENVLRQTATEMAASGNTRTEAVSNKLKVLLNLETAKLIVPQLTRIVGVQPMSYPVGQLFMLRYKTTENSAPATEASGFLGMRNMTLEVVANAVEATSRQLRAGFSVEAMQDLCLVHKLDLESEIKKAVAHEISGEIINEVIADLLRLGTTTDISELGLVNLASTDGNASAIRLTHEIGKLSTDIAVKSCRGTGNYAIVPPHVLAILEMLEDGSFTRVALPPGGFDWGHLIHVGNLGSLKVYTSLAIVDSIVIGYKGGNGETDAGYFLAPYIPAMATGIVTNTLTFQPCMMFMTRYGKALNGDRESAEKYYRVLKLDALEQKLVPEDWVSDQA